MAFNVETLVEAGGVREGGVNSVVSKHIFSGCYLEPRRVSAGERQVDTVMVFTRHAPLLPLHNFCNQPHSQPLLYPTSHPSNLSASHASSGEVVVCGADGEFVVCGADGEVVICDRDREVVVWRRWISCSLRC